MHQLTKCATPLPVSGIRLATASAGIRKIGKVDLCLLEIAEGAHAAGVFTRNVFCAAPVSIAREHLAQRSPRLLVINSGNANAGTGQQGHQDALDVCATAARLLGCEFAAVLPFSTGVIGQRLAVSKLLTALPQAIENLAQTKWSDAARAIMTTDKVPKCVSAQVAIGQQVFTVTGIAKGAGMIKPNMATMLAFIATDAGIEQEPLQQLLREVSDKTFNRITIDGDTSTNDSCVLIATGNLESARVKPGDSAFKGVAAAVEYVARELARAIVRDGEGATKLVNVKVAGGDSEAECLKAAYAVAESPLVKTALFASDPNWGRILAAVGRSGVTNLKIEQIGIALNDYPIIQHGEPVAAYDEAIAAKIMAEAEFDIRISLGQSTHEVVVLTCDFSFDYVRINAEYRS
jgi:glutamate N-acetyltransferase / amino-acid N-acetyltransferase